MMKNVKYLIILLMIVCVPKFVFAVEFYLVGNASASAGPDKFYGTPKCNAGNDGSVSVHASGGVNKSDGKCTNSSHIRSGSSDYCCPSGYNLNGNKCEKKESKTTYVDPVNNVPPTVCGYMKAYWVNGKCYRSKSTNEMVVDSVDASKYVYAGNYVIVVTGKGTCNSSGNVRCTDEIGNSKNYSLITFNSDWKLVSTEMRCYLSGKPSMQQMKYSSGNFAFEKPSGSGVFCYNEVYSRGCGGSIPSSDVQMGCYRAPSPSGSQGYDEYVYAWSFKGDPRYKNYTFYPETKNFKEAQCVPKKPSVCSPSAIKSDGDSNNKAEYCSQKDVKVSLNSGYACQKDSSTFYTYNCIDEVNASYDPVGFTKVNVGNRLDERIISLKAGEGFKFNVNLKHQKSCKGSFNAGLFNEAIKMTDAFISRAEATANNEKEIAWYTGLREDIINIARDYVKLYTNLDKKNEYAFNYVGSLGYKYNYNGQTGIEKNASFELSDASTFKVEKNNITNTQTLANGMRVNDFDYVISENAVLEPAKVYFDKYTGLETTIADDKLRVDGGNKFYTELKTDVTNGKYYDINIKIDVYSGRNIIATITNDKCDLNIYGEDLKYRIIDVTNPFVNNSRKVAQNWLNNIYDYTKVIKSDTWSRTPLYTFKIYKDDLVNIKNSNDAKRYLGTCYKEANLQDNAIKKICEIINGK